MFFSLTICICFHKAVTHISHQCGLASAASGEEGDDEEDCDWISCKDEVEISNSVEHSYIGKIFHDKAKKEADGSPNPFATGTVVDIMRNVDEEDLHLYFKYFNHEATDGKQPTDSEEDEDKWGYTGCAEMLKTGRGASFTWPHLRAAA